MKQQLEKQLSELNKKYGWAPRLLMGNMRLVLLLLFAGLSGFLVLKINTLVSSDGTEVTEQVSEGAAAKLSKSPDADVLSVFNELSVQEVELNSSFESNRSNPF